VNVGLSDVIGSWNIIAISLPRTRASDRLAPGPTSDWPRQRTSPAVILTGQLDEARCSACAVTLLPDPALADEAERLAGVACGS
jgi:hypothetical protein